MLSSYLVSFFQDEQTYQLFDHYCISCLNIMVLGEPVWFLSLTVTSLVWEANPFQFRKVLFTKSEFVIKLVWSIEILGW